jgi:hypothetical protein
MGTLQVKHWMKMGRSSFTERMCVCQEWTLKNSAVISILDQAGSLGAAFFGGGGGECGGSPDIFW